MSMDLDVDVPLAAALFWEPTAGAAGEWMIELADRTGELRLLLPYRCAAIGDAAHRAGIPFEQADRDLGEQIGEPPVRPALPLRLVQSV